MQIGIMGAGSIGGFVGAKLVAWGADVVFVGRESLAESAATHGMTLRDVAAPELSLTPEQLTVSTKVGALASCELILCCVKSLQTEQVARSMAPVLSPGAVVLSLQNGVGNARILREHLPDQIVCPGIVDFNVVSQPGGVYIRGLSGPLKFEHHDAAVGAFELLSQAGFLVERHAALEPAQWTKLLVNLNNAISALSGMPTRQMLLDATCRRIIADVVSEAIGVLRHAQVPMARLRGIPVTWMPPVLRWPTWLVRLALGSQLKIDPEARSSMWEDLQRKRLTEVDFLNGEIVRLAESKGIDAPLNRRIVARIHEAERRREGSPQMEAQSLAEALRGG